MKKQDEKLDVAVELRSLKESVQELQKVILQRVEPKLENLTPVVKSPRSACTSSPERVPDSLLAGCEAVRPSAHVKQVSTSALVKQVSKPRNALLVDKSALDKGRKRAGLTVYKGNQPLLTEEARPPPLDLDPGSADSALLSARSARVSSRNDDGYSPLQANRGVDEEKALALSREDKKLSCNSNQAAWIAFVESAKFEQMCGVIVLLNALTIGVEADQRIRHPTGSSGLLYSIDLCFCMMFTVELLVRIYAYRSQFFCVEGYIWNIFDSIIVSFQIIDQVVSMSSCLSIPIDRNSFAIFRLLRAIRIARLVRVLHLFQELRTIVYSIVKSFMALFWTILLLFFLIYGFSVAFMQLAMSSSSTSELVAAEADVADPTELSYYFGNLGRTMLTLFEVIVGGADWDILITLLIRERGVMMSGLFFCFYIAFALFVMLNVVTGVFVDTAMIVAKEEADLQLASNLCRLFFSQDEGESNSNRDLSWEEFENKLKSPTLLTYFESIGVNVSAADELFRLYDEDGNGTVDAEEMVSGFLRLRGPARSIDLHVLMQRQKDMNDLLEHFVFESSAKLNSLGYVQGPCLSRCS
eukprot:TRINITY_DN59251_c0_g1_i1.p1 TRINITY_DN59251_c0_g1~~TRINITY_DN59251_c0_g1_i1.p1  ORF type:complete len:584 (+),score=120.08 TRINITY_DN59251_c0_g1_i1:76-1827(+)